MAAMRRMSEWLTTLAQLNSGRTEVRIAALTTRGDGQKDKNTEAINGRTERDHSLIHLSRDRSIARALPQ